MRLFFLLGLIIHFTASWVVSQSDEINPWDLSLFERIIHRKNVSHLIIEARREEFRLTLMVSDRFPYNYKSRQYPFYMRFQNEKDALQTLKKFDEQLQSGYEIYIRLNGSEIIHYRFLGRN